MRVFDLQVSVAAVTGNEELTGTVTSAGDLDGDLDGELTSSDVLEAVVQPRGTAQWVNMELWVDGVQISQQSLSETLSVSRDYDNIVQSWGFTTPLQTAAGVFGTPFACVGPGIGTSEVTICGVYAFADGSLVRVNLLTNGIVDNAHREAGEGGIFETFNGVDSGGRYDGVKITKQFPPGHGLHRGRVGREVMYEVGETRVSFEDGAQMRKELQLVDAEPFPTLAEIFEVENRKILWDSDAYVTNPQVGAIRSGESPVFTFEERDILRISTVSLDSVANVITLIIANGTRQKTKDACAIVWETTTEYTYQGPYSRKTSAFIQSVDGTYTPVTPKEAEDSVLTKKIETRRAYKCDTLIEEIVTTWEMARTEYPRHEWEGGDGTDPELDEGWRCLSIYTDDNDGVGGGPAYLDKYEFLRVVSIAHTKYFYVAQDYASPFFSTGLSTGITWMHKLLESPRLYGDLYDPAVQAEEKYGQAQGSVTFFTRFGHIEGSIKERGPYAGFPIVPWSEVEPDAGMKIWGNGRGVGPNPGSDLLFFVVPPGSRAYPGTEHDELMPWSYSCNVLHGDDNNFLIGENTYEYEWRAPDGSKYYYGENDIRSQEMPTFGWVRSNLVTYASEGNSHTKSETRVNEVTGDTTTIVTNGIPGHLPAIERLDEVAANPVIYEDGEEDELAEDTSRGDTEQITVTVPFDFFLTCHVPREVVVDFPWAEDEEELLAQAEAMAQESAAMIVNFTLPANFLIRETMPIHLTYRPLGIDHDMRVKTVRWEMTTGQAILTPVTCKLYGF